MTGLDDTGTTPTEDLSSAVESLVPREEKVRLIDNRLRALAVERYQAEVGKVAGDTVTAERIARLDESIEELQAMREAA